MVMTCWALFSDILRANFDGSRSKAVPIAPKAEEGDGVAEYRSGARVIALKDVGDRVEVQYEDAHSQAVVTISAGLVVVADGGNSSMRKLLMPNVRRKYAGYLCWRGTIPERSIDTEGFNEKYGEKAAFHFMRRSYLIQ
jgi:2-polyprenyl-6-methoxyphenol hydroxylase-like FAD-dependent oxidoreductase